MAGQWEPQAAAAVVGLATFELWKAWNSTAPSLADMRNAEPGDIGIQQKLLDADLTIGSLALIIGAAISIMTRDLTAMILIITIFGALSLWHHSILAAEPR